MGKRPRTGDLMDDPRARRTITDQVAASGTRCLRVWDAPGVRFPWLPRNYWPFDWPQKFTIKNISNRFQRLERVLISSLSKTHGLFHLDNVHCETE